MIHGSRTFNPRERHRYAFSALPSLPLLVILSLAALSLTAHAQFRYQPAAFHAGERLTYKVKWSFIRIGTVVVTQDFADPDFPRYMQVWINGESAAGLPFIDVLFRSTALLHVEHPTNILYELFTDREERQRTAYIYDRMNSRMFALETELGDIVRLDTLEAPVPYYDGPGLFMFTRSASGSDTTVLVPTVMDFAIGQTTIRFSDVVEHIDVAAFEDKVPSYKFQGTTRWKGAGFAGMSGNFSGWVSTDSTRIVLRAEVEIFLGSAVIELESISDRE